MRRYLLAAGLALLAWSGPVSAEDAPAGKRVGPPDVAPVVIGRLSFEAIHWGRERGLAQNGGYVAAKDAASGKELWIHRIYRTRYDPKLESDVQDVFIAGMEPCRSGRHLCIVDERDRHFELDPVTRKARRIGASPKAK